MGTDAGATALGERPRAAPDDPDRAIAGMKPATADAARRRGDILGLPASGHAVSVQRAQSHRVAIGRVAEPWVRRGDPG